MEFTKKEKEIIFMALLLYSDAVGRINGVNQPIQKEIAIITNKINPNLIKHLKSENNDIKIELKK